jgi:hypothetical protein
MKETTDGRGVVMRTISVVFLSLVLAGCQSTMDETARSRVEEEVLDWTDEWLATLEALDVEANLALHRQEDFTWTTGGVFYDSWDVYEQWVTGVYEKWQGWDGVWKAREVSVMNPDAAVVRGLSNDMVTLADGRRVETRNTWTFYLVRTGEGWKVAHGHSSGSACAIHAPEPGG